MYIMYNFKTHEAKIDINIKGGIDNTIIIVGI